jgi:hypothetical protein
MEWSEWMKEWNGMVSSIKLGTRAGHVTLVERPCPTHRTNPTTKIGPSCRWIYVAVYLDEMGYRLGIESILVAHGHRHGKGSVSLIQGCWPAPLHCTVGVVSSRKRRYERNLDRNKRTKLNHGVFLHRNIPCVETKRSRFKRNGR